MPAPLPAVRAVAGAAVGPAPGLPVLQAEPGPKPAIEADRWTPFPAVALTMADRVTKATANGRKAILRGTPRRSWPEPLPRTSPPLRNRCWVLLHGIADTSPSLYDRWVDAATAGGAERRPWCKASRRCRMVVRSPRRRASRPCPRGSTRRITEETMEAPVVVPMCNTERGERAEVAETSVEDPPPHRHNGTRRDWNGARPQSKSNRAGGGRARQAVAEPRSERHLPVAASRRLQLRRESRQCTSQ